MASRRAFLRDVAIAAVGAIAISGLAPAMAMAMAERVTEVSPSRAAGLQRVYSLPDADTIQVDIENEVILSRWRNRVYAFSTRCPHKGATLQWRGDETRFFCPKHKARFSPDGTHVSGRGSRALDRYDIARAGGSIAVDVGALRREDQAPAAWSAAVVALGTSM